ncbi:hypothetical protein [Stenotrophomonas sp. SY1]|jgi:hypothetical protein|uniref:hypothetical protein n=1 Tax=Stenotrophomonas sp. SY1 TaxID=477235 RepID=UPI001E47EF80|nr:hypothetical protein [Stenotrophomonas sp. SY1]MCD9085496.1 hypothetical protein [Stenotrophomonas sp. SY1]
MNAKSLALAIAIVAGSGFASSVQAADIVTLETVQVRPSVEQLAQAEHEATSTIPTLAAVQVRPTVGQIVELMAEQAATRLASATPVASVANWVVSLPAVTVRPDVQQVQALAAELAADAIGNVVAKGLVKN